MADLLVQQNDGLVSLLLSLDVDRRRRGGPDVDVGGLRLRLRRGERLPRSCALCLCPGTTRARTARARASTLLLDLGEPEGMRAHGVCVRVRGRVRGLSV